MIRNLMKSNSDTDAWGGMTNLEAYIKTKVALESNLQLRTLLQMNPCSMRDILQEVQ